MDGLLDTAPCGFLSLADDGAVLDVNRTLADALGTTPDSLRSRGVRSVLAPGSRIYFQTHVLPLLRLGGEISEVYLSFRTAGDDNLPVLLNARRQQRGGAPVYDFVVVPIQRRSRFEDEILEARRAAEAASQARARFLSMMSHDLRSPLSAIVMSADLVARGAFGPLAEAQAAELERIATAGRYVLRLVSDVLDFSRLESGRVDVRLRPIRVAEAVGGAEALVALQADEAGVEMVHGGGPPDAVAQADPDRLQQVLLNLLGNAIKFTGRDGRVTTAWDATGDRVLIHVRDTGPGIAPDRLAEVFDPFVRGDYDRVGAGEGGVGLGLAISRELVGAMGGGLTVESELGEGATFTVALPLADEEASGAEPVR